MPRDSWIFHPENGNQTHIGVDIAVMKIAEHGGIRSFFYCPKEDCPKDKIALAKEDMEPPTPVMVFGFPLNEPGLKLLRSVPLGRQGIIALIDKQEDEIQVEGKYFDRLGFVIDIPTMIGGSSGSPVISVQPFAPNSLVGIISASAESDKPDSYAVAGGYAVAEPVSRIKDLLENPKVENAQPVDTWCLVSQDDAMKISPPWPVCH